MYEIREVDGTHDICVGAWPGDTPIEALDQMAGGVGFADFATARSGPWQHFPLLPDNRRATDQPDHY